MLLENFYDSKLEMQIFNNEREYPRMFLRSKRSFLCRCHGIYIQQNWMKEDIRRKVTTKLFFSLHFLLQQDLTVLLNALSFHLGQYIFKWLVVKVHCNAIKKVFFQKLMQEIACISVKIHLPNDPLLESTEEYI